MNKNPDIPPDWSMPDDLANQVSEALNKKSITPEQELQDALEDMARDIAIIDPNPQDWGWWVSYLLEQLEAEAQRRGKHIVYESMLNSITKDIKERVDWGAP